MAAASAERAQGVNAPAPLPPALDPARDARATLSVDEAAAVDQALLGAAGAGDTAGVLAALAAGADADKMHGGGRGHGAGRTPLFVAAEKGREVVVERLLAAGADADRATVGGGLVWPSGANLQHKV